jgi:predicted PurR-regulated permease PerM
MAGNGTAAAEQRSKTRWKWFAILVAAAVLIALIWRLSSVLQPVFFAGLLSYAAHPLVDRLERTRLGRRGAIALVVVLGVSLVLLFLLYLIPSVIEQVQSVVRRLPEIRAKLSQVYFDVVVPWASRTLRLDLPATADELGGLLGERGGEVMPLVWSTIRTGLAGALTGTVSVAGALLNILLVPFFSYFFLRDFNKFTRAVKELVPPRHRETAYSLLGEIDAQLQRYMRGAFTVFGILTVIYVTGLSIIGLKGAVALGVLSGLLFFLPYIGPMIAFVLSELIAVLNFGSWWVLLWIALLYLFATQLESWVLTPKITGGQVGLPGWQVILLVIIFASLFGVGGVIIAIPFGAVLKIVARRLRDAYLRSEFYLAERRCAPAGGQETPDPATRSPGA